MFCENCGKQINDDATFCPFCGQSISGSNSESSKHNNVSSKKKSVKWPIISIVLIVIVFVTAFVARELGLWKFSNQKNVTDNMDTNVSADLETTIPAQISQPQVEVETLETETDTEEKAIRTVMIYMIGSNLESGKNLKKGGFASADIDEILAADIPENVNVILECGGSTKWYNDAIPDGTVTRFVVKNHKLEKLQELGSISMTKEGSLSDFITYVMDNYPAENYTIDFWDHGGGIPVGFGCDELGDFHNLLTSYEIKSEIAKANAHFDVVIFDACNVGTLEMGVALKDYSNYMIGAESVVAGNGLYYTNWLADTDKDCQRFCETAAKDYISKVHESGGSDISMSLIRLDNIDNVYSRYSDYMSLLYGDIKNGGYKDYAKVRATFNEFNSVDSIDLVTLATKYENEKSTGIQNAVTNLVVWTESDLNSAHGITIYSPILYESYGSGRRVFTELNYDSDIIDFYDCFMSQVLAYFGTEEDIQKYGGSWFDSSYLNSSEVAVTEVRQLNTELIDNRYYATEVLTPEEWGQFQQIEFEVWWTIDNNIATSYGSTYDYTKSSDGRLVFIKPKEWVMINGHVAHWDSSYFNNDAENGVEFAGFIPAILNDDKNIALYVICNKSYPDGKIIGYVDYDIIYGKNTSEDVYQFAEDDVIDLVFPQYNVEEGKDYILKQNDPIKVSDIKMEWSGFSFIDKVNVLGRYIIRDVYGRTLDTRFCKLVEYE